MKIYQHFFCWYALCLLTTKYINSKAGPMWSINGPEMINNKV
jgi:hypothetical protein